MLLLDTRRGAHAGSGAASSFEFAVSAAASIGVHLALEGLAGQLVTDTGAVTAAGMFEDVLLDSLAVVKPSRGDDLSGGTGRASGSGGGLLIVVAGRLSAASARQLATSRRDGGPAIALLLAVSTWGAPGARKDRMPRPGRPGRLAERARPAGRTAQGGQRRGTRRRRPAARPHHAETGQAAAILPAAGWRVITLDAAMPLATAWQRMARHGCCRTAGHRSADMPGGSAYEPPADGDRGRGRRSWRRSRCTR